ncbi:hypothetical protein COLO4_19646 [Corchorus olitorius]|uniref:DUF4283 domain-containing protein n=1 Tax=Corchorus olitorius TaxID=93759 RepID=A0A1R3J493_9ROSI|nr:hypothetical protein COLO4_19646 [Corchorus olitorius]
MKLEAGFLQRRSKRRSFPYLKPDPACMQKKQKFHPNFHENFEIFDTAMNPPNPSNPPNPPNSPRIFFQRKCSWTDSDSSTQGSSDSTDSNRTRRQPPPWRQRETNRVSFTTEKLQPYRNEGRESLIGFLLDSRRYSTRFLQSQINNAWTLVGTATVLGRDDNHYIVHFDNDVDRRAAVMGNPWCFEGASFIVGHWSPNIPISETRSPEKDPGQRGESEHEVWFPHPHDPAHNHYSNRMQAFLNRASIRTTRMVIRQRLRQAQGNAVIEEDNRILNAEGNPPMAIETQSTPPLNEGSPQPREALNPSIPTQGTEMAHTQVERTGNENGNQYHGELAGLNFSRAPSTQPVQVREEVVNQQSQL